MKEKLEYIKNNICSKHNKLLYIKTGSSKEEIEGWYELGYVPKNMHILLPECSMIFEQFTIGHKDESGHWISEYNAQFDALIIDHVQAFAVTLPNMRIQAWETKPLYIISDQIKERIIDRKLYYREYKFDEVIEVDKK